MADDIDLCISVDERVATLWLGRSGLPAFDRALEEVIARPDLEILVIRAATPAGFSAGFASGEWPSESEAAAYASAGQRLFRKLSDAPLVTLAFVEGPCLGPAFELALACDYRLAVEGPNSRVGFGDAPTCWGGRTRWRQLTDRPAPTSTFPRDLKIFDGVCCERRAKIDLRTWLDRLSVNPKKRRVPWRSRFVDRAEGFAEERRQFVRHRPAKSPNPWPAFDTLLPIPAFPKVVGIVGDSPRSGALAWEIATRGHRVIRLTDGATLPRPKRLTPLELQQAEGRIAVAANASALAECGWVIVDDSGLSPAFLERALPARTILAVAPADAPRFAELAHRPQRIAGLEFAGDSLAVVYPQPETTPDALAALGAWLQMLGHRPVVTHERTPVESDLRSRARLGGMARPRTESA